MVFRTIGMLSSISNVIIYYVLLCIMFVKKKKFKFQILTFLASFWLLFHFSILTSKKKNKSKKRVRGWQGGGATKQYHRLAMVWSGAW